jgi:hypothetical protein
LDFRGFAASSRPTNRRRRRPDDSSGSTSAFRKRPDPDLPIRNAGDDLPVGRHEDLPAPEDRSNRQGRALGREHGVTQIEHPAAVPALECAAPERLGGAVEREWSEDRHGDDLVGALVRRRNQPSLQRQGSDRAHDHADDPTDHDQSEQPPQHRPYLLVLVRSDAILRHSLPERQSPGRRATCGDEPAGSAVDERALPREAG